MYELSAKNDRLMFAVEPVHVAAGTEIAVFRRHLRTGDLVHELFMTLPVFLERVNRDDLKSQLLGQPQQLLRAHHRSVVAHDLAAQAAFLETRESHQIHSRFGMAVPFQHAVFLRAQREHMARPAEIRRLHVVGHAGPRGDPAFHCGDAGGRFDKVDGIREGRFVIVGIVRDHLGKQQRVAQLAAHGHADQPLRPGRHQVNIFCRRKLSCADHIAFVFPVFVVGDEDDLSRAQIVKRFFDC